MFKKKSFKESLVLSHSPNSVSPTGPLTVTPPGAPALPSSPNGGDKGGSQPPNFIYNERIINGVEEVEGVSISTPSPVLPEFCNSGKQKLGDSNGVGKTAIWAKSEPPPLEQVHFSVIPGTPFSPPPTTSVPLVAIGGAPLASTSATGGEAGVRVFTPFRPSTGARVETQRSQSAGSAKSTASSVTSSNADICRICHCEGLQDAPLISPCYCSGSLKYVHQKCLQQWIKSSQTRSCEVCRFSFIMQTKLKPFRKWEKLDISSVERRKILCSVAFHIIAITCVMWSLYVLIDRTAEEIRDSSLEWPFWTKLVVVAIGFTGGLVFMYVQCKMYVQLFRRWRAYNKVICVQNGPSGPSFSERKDQHPINLEQK